MSSDIPEVPDDDAARVEVARIEDEMEQSYIDYAMSVIAGRALPDVRDGLKPVHRRILYAMHEAGVTSGSGHRKSSSIVGETMGDFHPHGDSAIYDTLARMAQDFSMREPLVDGQGNFGSVDGDPPAAMRYTEARMAPIAEELLADIEKDTVDFSPNYDDRLEEPDVLPAAFPNLLVNGSSGIAVGMSTNVPPHNLGEIIDATIHLIDNPECSIEELMEHVPGPDFPTGANIVGRNSVYKAYKTGRGKVRMRAEFEVDEASDRIIVTELPYQQNKARMIERIADDVNEGSIEGIRDLRDESDRDGIRIVIELKQGAMAEVVKNQLLDSHLERTFGVINLALVDGAPRVLNLKETLEEYLKHRREVVRRRSQYELDEAEDRAHILEGRLKALDNVDDVIETIRNSEDRDGAKSALRDRFGFSQPQVEHIVAMQLGSLTSMEAEEIEREYEQVQSRIERLTEILENVSELLGVIKTELREIKDEYADERRTRFVEDTGSVTHEDLIPEEEMVVTMSEDDYIKRVALSTFRTQNRGGKGIIGTDLKEGDRVSSVFVANTHDLLLVFTTHGQIYELKTYQIPEMSRTARGKSAVNLLDLDDGEEISAVVTTDALSDGQFLTMVTRDGYIKRTAADQFENILSTGIRAIRLEDGDKLIDVEVTDGERDIIIGTRGGMSIRFDETEVRAMGRSARGVRGIRLTDDDTVAGVAAVNTDRHNWVLTVTEHGYGKRTNVDAYRVQSRNGKGLIDIKTNDRNGPVVGIAAVAPGDHLVTMSENGQIMRTRVEDLSIVGRNTMGVTVMAVDGDDRVTCMDIVPAADLATEEWEDETDDDRAIDHASDVDVVEPTDGEAQEEEAGKTVDVDEPDGEGEVDEPDGEGEVDEPDGEGEMEETYSEGEVDGEADGDNLS